MLMWGTRESGVCVCVLVAVVWVVLGESVWAAWARVWGWWGGVMYVCVVWSIRVDGRSRCLYIVLGGYSASYVHPVFNPVAPYRYLLPNLYVSVADIANPDLFACSSGRSWNSLDIARFYEEHFQPSSGSARLLCPHCRGPEGLAQCAQGFPYHCDSSTGSVFWSSGVMVCSSFTISVCMFIVSKDLLISCFKVIFFRSVNHLVEPLCYGII